MNENEINQNSIKIQRIETGKENQAARTERKEATEKVGS